MLNFLIVKEATEGFLYISKRFGASLIISDLLSSHKHWKERYFFIGGHNKEYKSVDREDTLGIPTVWTALENLCEFSFVLVGVSFTGYEEFLTLLWLCFLQVSVLILVLRIRR